MSPQIPNLKLLSLQRDVLFALLIPETAQHILLQPDNFLIFWFKMNGDMSSPITLFSVNIIDHGFVMSKLTAIIL